MCRMSIDMHPSPYAPMPKINLNKLDNPHPSLYAQYMEGQ